jgi:hypothetical protein
MNVKGAQQYRALTSHSEFPSLRGDSPYFFGGPTGHWPEDVLRLYKAHKNIHFCKKKKYSLIKNSIQKNNTKFFLLKQDI